MSTATDEDDEVIWATSTTGEDFQCVHVADWREARKRIAALEAAIREMIRSVPGGTHCDPQEVCDTLRGIAETNGVNIET